MPEGEKTFVRITNQHIYDKLEEVCSHVEKTNGKVRLNRWISTTALTLTTSTVIGFIILIATGGL